VWLLFLLKNPTSYGRQDRHPERRASVRRIIFLICVITTANVGAVLSALGQPQDAPWPTFRHDLQHTGRSQYIGPDEPIFNWSFTTGYYVYSSPAVGSDGTIYVGSEDYKLYSLNPDGSLQWSFPTAGGLYSSPAVGCDGSIYVGSLDSRLYAIGPGIGLPNVTISLTPDATAVERGGTLGYTVEVSNNTDEDQTFEYWSDVYLWTGEPYKNNPVFGPKQVTLKASKTKSGRLSHKVPNSAPLKAYTLCGRIGWHPDDVWDEDCFELEVVESLGLYHEGDDWEVIESSF
jgi:hypothetical protein